ncbi:hypothetical protein [Candidatus Thalassarchaeum betae]
MPILKEGGGGCWDSNTTSTKGTPEAFMFECSKGGYLIRWTDLCN